MKKELRRRGVEFENNSILAKLREKLNRARAKAGEELLTCSCCGKFFHGVWRQEDEVGFGTCPECEDWSRNVIVSSRIDLVRKHLSPENVRRFDAMNKLQKEHVIFELINRGVII